MILYKTLLKEGMAEQTIEKSRFIAYAKPVKSRQEAEEFIASIKKKHKDATHNVPAMVLGDKFQVQWASDDGEPQGTSGAPIVQMLVNEKITNVALVVTRYFGGIKLGTGGLVRAYTGSAKLGLEAAGICNVKEVKSLKYQVDYSVFNKIQNFNYFFDAKIENIVYTNIVAFEMIVNLEDEQIAKETIDNLSSGVAILEESTCKLNKFLV